MKDPNVNTTYTGLLHKYQPSAEHHPCYSGLQVQGAATTPAARYFNYTCYTCLLSRCEPLNHEQLAQALLPRTYTNIILIYINISPFSYPHSPHTQVLRTLEVPLLPPHDGLPEGTSPLLLWSLT